MKEFLVREAPDFKLRVRVSDCLLPEGVKHLEFVGEQYKDGKLIADSTYEFFLDQVEIQTLCQGLAS